MLMAANADPALAAYRDEILFNQTIHRYGNAWHHRQPFWYFLVNVIPALWLPLTLLVPWLFSYWRDALRALMAAVRAEVAAAFPGSSLSTSSYIATAAS